jgi:hypothetical protein
LVWSALSDVSPVRALPPVASLLAVWVLPPLLEEPVVALVSPTLPPKPPAPPRPSAVTVGVKVMVGLAVELPPLPP